MQPGWYPDPLGSTAERYWDGSWGDDIRASQRRLTGQALSGGNGAGPGRGGLRLRSLRPSFGPLGRAARERRDREREDVLRQRITELARQEFYCTPAGRAARIAGSSSYTPFDTSSTLDLDWRTTPMNTASRPEKRETERSSSGPGSTRATSPSFTS